MRSDLRRPVRHRSRRPGTGPTGTGGEVFTKQQIDPLLADIVKKTPKKLPITRLAEGLIPPTNRWFSGLAFGDEALPVFPHPAQLRAHRRRLRLRAADR